MDDEVNSVKRFRPDLDTKYLIILVLCRDADWIISDSTSDAPKIRRRNYNFLTMNAWCACAVITISQKVGLTLQHATQWMKNNSRASITSNANRNLNPSPNQAATQTLPHMLKWRPMLPTKPSESPIRKPQITTTARERNASSGLHWYKHTASLNVISRQTLRVNYETESSRVIILNGWKTGRPYTISTGTPRRTLSF